MLIIEDLVYFASKKICDEILSCMIEIWLKNLLVSDK